MTRRTRIRLRNYARHHAVAATLGGLAVALVVVGW